MTNQEAAKLISETFQNPFDEGRFRVFAKNLFNDLDESKNFDYYGQYIPDAYKDHVKRYKRIGQYTDPEGSMLDVLIVNLKKETALDRARTMQRNFMAWYLKNRGEKDAAIAAYHTDELEDWRFSYIRMDYRTVEEKGKVKVKEELTPARRYSFLVGKNEPNHTAQQQLSPILEDDRNNPTLSELEKAFNIESVTEEFFNRYKNLFLNLKEKLDCLLADDTFIKKDFEEKQIETTNFAKKLLGQIVFLYFLQKKGWLGVGKDEVGKFKEWGTGPKNFLRKLFDKKIGGGYNNFFNDVLEHLFYEALAFPRENQYYSRLDCKIPFLNGGLFEPIGGYNWQETDILIANEIFSEIFNTFDLYNFTVREDEPLEKEVAVDPEMLGKVFENLLEVKDRKSKGAYYTPRQIVHFMCQESLINYIDKAFNSFNLSPPENLQSGFTDACSIPHQDIETFVRSGEFLVEHDKRVVAEGRETKDYPFKMPETIRKNAGLIDQVLSDIKVCDPAIGSGAFPIGMLHEMVKARDALSSYLENPGQRSRYEFKRHAIQNSIYGVDIDQGAVEIAKLRLWLSLVVDEDDYHSIKPLPNLDYKIMQGNSLFEEYEGIKLFDDSRITPKNGVNRKDLRNSIQKQIMLQQEFFNRSKSGKLTKEEETQYRDEIRKQSRLINSLKDKNNNTEEVGLFDDEASKIAEELMTLHKEYFEATHKSKKDKLRIEIEEHEWRLIKETLKVQGKEKALTEIRRLEKSSHKPFFIWKLHFAEVFQEKGGFDVVIANPPYVRHEGIKQFKTQLSKEFGSFYCGTADLYTYFYKKGLSLLQTGGHLCFIAPNKFMRAGYGKNTRELLTKEVNPKVVIDFGDLPIFDATTYPSILLVEKTPVVGANQPVSSSPIREPSFLAATFTDSSQLECIEDTLSTIGFSIPVSALKSEGWNLERPEVHALMEKLRKTGKPLGEYVQGRFYYGIKTGFNEAFVIDSATREKLIAEDPKSAELIKSWLRGRDIRKWKTEWAGLYLVAIASSANREWPWSKETTEAKARELFVKTYPAIHKHLSQWDPELRKRDDQGKFWWELRSCAYYKEFEKPKIIYPEVSADSRFAIEEGTHYSDKTTFIIPCELEEAWYITLLANSKLLSWFHKKLGSMMRGQYFMNSKIYIEQLPIFPATASQKAPVIERVQKILAAQNTTTTSVETGLKPVSTNHEINTAALETEIDQLVYDLYDLTKDEIALVEGRNKSGKQT